MPVLESVQGPHHDLRPDSTKKDLCERGNCRAAARLSDRLGDGAFQEMELQGTRVERLWITVTCFKME